MSTELLLCPYCGNDEPDTTTTEPLAMDLHDDDSVRCGMEGCPIENVIMLVRQWNRRFVCPDKNEDPVFAGDEVKATDYTGKVDRLGGIYLESEDGHLHHVWPSEIELVKKAP